MAQQFLTKLLEDTALLRFFSNRHLLVQELLLAAVFALAMGAEIVAGLLTDEQVAWVRHHHERWDGGGYPDGLAGEEIPLLDELTEFELTALRYYTGAETKIGGCGCYVSRTGYTGEPLGFELFMPRDSAAAIWNLLIEKGATPVGLGARDTLRLEAGLPLYGHELGADPDWTPEPNLDGVREPIVEAAAEDSVESSAPADEAEPDREQSTLDQRDQWRGGRYRQCPGHGL